ncbi:thermonuclease family protein [Candidatus Nitrosocosmicus franklandus]|uniref:Thermonuclease n=1 Tax=Candidatus Nitrosocosmicus franklandianus TaxID=1798806 RepID=A0A484IB70_9ARCH|nr:thermonuclease family protein [Candidatus Nitrosocosmicus franklandus]VFJ13477.1 Thermonuclease [Candidatus Nitrosocosmicus franklandus]
MLNFLYCTKIFAFLVVLGTFNFSNPVWPTSANSDSVTTSSINFDGIATKVIDGDTLDVSTQEGDVITIRLALIDAPERNEPGFNEAKSFVTEQCLNKNVEVDPDNNQGLTYGRTVAVVYCEGINVNEAILDNNLADIYEDFCDISEFANTNWAREHGCSNSRSDSGDDNGTEKEDPVESDNSNVYRFDLSDTSRDLDCKDFDEKNIPVGDDDPHNLDADGDGIGCEG